MFGGQRVSVVRARAGVVFRARAWVKARFRFSGGLMVGVRIGIRVRFNV